MLTVRRLSLRAEHLTALSEDDLGAVAGGTTQLFTGYYPSLNAPCTVIVENLTTLVGPSAGC